MDRSYIDGWRTIERIYSKLFKAKDSLTNRINTVDDCTQDAIWIANITEDATKSMDSSKNGVVRLLETKEFFRKWLWYTEGFISPNPFYSTTPDKEYPETELYTFKDSPAVKKLTRSIN